MAELETNSISTLFRNPHTAPHNATPFYILTRGVQGFQIFHSHTSVCCFLSHSGHPNEHEVPLWF